MVLVCTGFAIPFCTWLLNGYFKAIPEDLEQAALIDGCSRLELLWRIVLPLAARPWSRSVPLRSCCRGTSSFSPTSHQIQRADHPRRIRTAFLGQYVNK